MGINVALMVTPPKQQQLSKDQFVPIKSIQIMH